MKRPILGMAALALSALSAGALAQQRSLPFHKPPSRSRQRRSPPARVLALEDGRAIVPSRRLWCSTGIEIERGQAVTISASGQMRGCQGPVNNWAFGPWGPEGFMHEGKMICCLIAKIEGRGWEEEFYVGKEHQFGAPLPGRLWLGVADFFHADNEGAFVVAVTVDGSQIDFWEHAKMKAPLNATRDRKLAPGETIDLGTTRDTETRVPVTGRVTDTKGRPLADVSVDCSVGTGTLKREDGTRTNENGEYRLWLRPGFVKHLSFTKAGYYGGRFAHRIKVTNETPRLMFNCRLRAFARLLGRVRDRATGKPLAGIRLALRPAPGAPSDVELYRLTKANIDGRFEFTDLTEGAFVLLPPDACTLVSVVDGLQGNVARVQIKAGEPMETELTWDAESMEPVKGWGAMEPDDPPMPGHMGSEHRSPDGRYVLRMGEFPDGEQNGLWIEDTKTRTRKFLLSASGAKSAPVWSVNSELAILCAGSGYRQGYPLHAYYPEEGRLVDLKTQGSAPIPSHDCLFIAYTSWASWGSWRASIPKLGGRMMILDLEGGEPRPVSPEIRRRKGTAVNGFVHPKWSLDDAYLAFIENVGHHQVLWVADTEVGENAPVLVGKGISYGWLPDSHVLRVKVGSYTEHVRVE